MTGIAAPRSLAYRSRGHNRYWWYRSAATGYVPPVLSSLTDEEWTVVDEWFTDTERRFPSPGEVNVPGISLLAGLIGGNGISAVVQCGHHVGYSTLLLGFLLRSMGKRRCIFSIDIDRRATDYTDRWMKHAGLEEQVRLHVASSSDPACVGAAREWFGGEPQLVFIDSSHQYAHTLEELDLWYAALTPGGFMVLHDVTDFASRYDPSGAGGVIRAAREWIRAKGIPAMLINHAVDGSQPVDSLVYKDGCGLGLIQKPL